MNDITSAPEAADNDAEIAAIFGLPAETPAAAAPAAEPEVPAPAEAPTTAPIEPASETPPVALPPLESPPSAEPPAAPASAPAVDAEAALKAASDAARLELLEAENARLKAAPAPASTAVPPEGSEPAAEAPTYALSIPDQVLAAITNEDPAVVKQGLNYLVNSILTIAHTQIRAEYRQDIGALRTELANGKQEGDRIAEARQLQEEYFADFPTHKNAVMEPIILRVAGQLAAEFPNAKWDANYRAALGTRVNAEVAKLTAAAGPSPTPAPAAVPAPKPAAFVPTGPRAAPAAAGSESALPDEVAALFA